MAREALTMTGNLHYRVRTRSPVVRFKYAEANRYLTVRGQRVYSMWVGCDSCSVLFEREPTPGLTRADVADRLRHGSDSSDAGLLGAIASLLPSGDYAVANVSVRPVMTVPGDPNDYFNRDSIDLFADDAGSINTTYWRAGSTQLPRDAGLEPKRRAGLHALKSASLAHEWEHPIVNATGFPATHKLFFHLLIPMEPPNELDPKRVAEYRRAADAGEQSTALGVSVLDIRAPANWHGDAAEYPEHWVLATWVLDGHHKIQAAAESGTAVRLLTFISRAESGATRSDIDALVSVLDAGDLGGI
jgi:hypothetical protein